MKHTGFAWLVVATLFTSLPLHAEDPAPPTPPETATASAPAQGPATVDVSKPTEKTDAADNLIRNGDFEHSKSGWVTRGKTVSLDGRGALEIDTDRREPQTLSTTIKSSRDIRTLNLSFDVKTSADYANTNPTGAMRLRIVKPNGGSLFHDVYLKPSSDWKTLHWQYEVPVGQRDFNFEIEFYPGKGSVYLTHFIAIGVEK